MIIIISRTHGAREGTCRKKIISCARNSISWYDLVTTRYFLVRTTYFCEEKNILSRAKYYLVPKRYFCIALFIAVVSLVII